jgi:hypothetical protein
VLHCSGYTRTPAYRDRPCHQFGRGHFTVHVDILTHPSDQSVTAWFPTARGDDLDDTLERAAHHAPMELCERHLPSLNDTAIALLPIRNKGNTVWSVHMATVGDLELLTYHPGWAFMARYAQHACSLLQEATVTRAHQHLCLEEYADQVKDKNRFIKDIQKGNRELLQKTHRLETRVKELNDELMRTYHSRDIKSDFLDDTCTCMKNAQDELRVWYCEFSKIIMPLWSKMQFSQVAPV